MKIGVGVLLITALVTSPALADDAVAPAFRIAIQVTDANEDLRERVTNYLTTELQAIPDVEATSEDPDYKLYAMIMQVRTSDGKRMAYVLGISVIRYFPDGYFESILREDLKNAAEVQRRLEEVTVYQNQFMSLAGPSAEDLQDIASNIVSKFDLYILGPERIKAASTELPDTTKN